MVESLARMKVLTERVDSLNDEAGALLARANEIGFDSPTRRDDVKDLLDQAAVKLLHAKDLMDQVRSLRRLAEAQRQRAEWVIRTTRHVVDEDKKPDAEVMAAKVQHVVKTHQQRQRGRRRLQLRQRFLRVDRELRLWFTNDHQPDVRPLLALLTLLVARVNTLEDEVQALKKTSSDA
jgi:hypothetical protein